MFAINYWRSYSKNKRNKHYHEQETLEFNTLTKSFDDSKQIIKELELFYTKFFVYLTKNEFDNTVVKKSNEKADLEIKNLKNIII